MGKPYNVSHHLSGSNCKIGAMICCVCHKSIDPLKQDWWSAQKWHKSEQDWGYITKHRDCVDDQSKWLKMEAAILDREIQLETLENELSRLFSEHGEELFIEALEGIGIEI